MDSSERRNAAGTHTETSTQDPIGEAYLRRFSASLCPLCRKPRPTSTSSKRPTGGRVVWFACKTCAGGTPDKFILSREEAALIS